MSDLKELYPGLYTWITMVTMDKMQMPLGSLYLIAGNDRILIDPTLPEGGFEAFDAHGKPTAILLTSDSHDRDSVKIKEHYNIPVYIHESMATKVEGLPDAKSFKAQGNEVITPKLQAIDLPGLEETTFLLVDQKLLIIGDAMIDMGNGPQPLPPQWVRNPSGYAEDL